MGNDETDEKLESRDENDRKQSVTIFTVRKRLLRFSVFSITDGNSPGFIIKVFIGDNNTMLIEIRKIQF
jgi:hypothetical protein